MQFGEVVKWCSRLQFIGLKTPKSTDLETIPLNALNEL